LQPRKGFGRLTAFRISAHQSRDIAHATPLASPKDRGTLAGRPWLAFARRTGQKRALQTRAAEHGA